MPRSRLHLFPLALASCISGAQPLPGETVLVSKSASGSPTNADVDRTSKVSGNGRYVVLSTTATNLHQAATSGTYEFFRKDLVTGSVKLVTSTPEGVASSQIAYSPFISLSGRWCTFTCKHLGSDDNTPDLNDVYLKDVATGSLRLVSTAEDGTQANADSSGGSMSADGQFIAFASKATNLLPGKTNPGYDAYVKDMSTGTLVRVSDRPDGQAVNGDVSGTLSSDGSKVILQSSVPLLPSDTHPGYDIYLKDLVTGRLTLVSVSSSGVLGNKQIVDLAGASADCRFIAFTSNSNNLVPGDTNLAVDLFVKDTRTGALRLASASSSGQQANRGCSGYGMSADGRFVLFTTSASNLVTNDTNDARDSYIKDLLTGECLLVSVNRDGFAAGVYDLGDISDNGSIGIFASGRENITLEPARYQELYARNTGVSSGPATTLSLLPSDLFIGEKVTLTATLRDKASHDGIAGDQVMFMVDSQVVGTATTNAYGVAKFAWIVPESFALGSHTLFASFAGDLDHARIDSEKFVTAQPGPVILSMPDKSGTVGHNVTLSATLKNAANQPLPGRTIEFRVDGALVGTGTTDGTGKATYTYAISVGAGAHEVSSHFAGETKHPEQTATATLTAT